MKMKKFFLFIVNVTNFNKSKIRMCIESIIALKLENFTILLVSLSSDFKEPMKYVQKEFPSYSIDIVKASSYKDLFEELKSDFRKQDENSYTIFVNGNDSLSESLGTDLQGLLNRETNFDLVYFGTDQIKLYDPSKTLPETVNTVKFLYYSSKEFIQDEIKTNSYFTLLNLYCINTKYLLNILDKKEIMDSVWYDSLLISELIYNADVISVLKIDKCNIDIVKHYDYSLFNRFAKNYAVQRIICIVDLNVNLIDIASEYSDSNDGFEEIFDYIQRQAITEQCSLLAATKIL